jgi:arylformamidase
VSWVYLSHILKESTPLYGGKGKVEIARVRSISNGDTSNNSDLIMSAHSGTHVDAPFHFDQEGKKLDEYSADYWFSSKPAMITFSASPGMIIRMKHLEEKLQQIPKTTDLLLLRSGAEEWRQNQKDAYSKVGVGLGTDVANWIRCNLNLKFIGLDFISVASPMHREEGRATHKSLLCKTPYESEPVLIIEDMTLTDLTDAPKNVWVVPFRYCNADGAMVTVLAKV